MGVNIGGSSVPGATYNNEVGVGVGVGVLVGVLVSVGVADGVGVRVMVGVSVGRGEGVLVANTPGMDNEQAMDVNRKITLTKQKTGWSLCIWE
jgi:hypothetical protein